MYWGCWQEPHFIFSGPVTPTGTQSCVSIPLAHSGFSVGAPREVELGSWQQEGWMEKKKEKKTLCIKHTHKCVRVHTHTDTNV